MLKYALAFLLLTTSVYATAADVSISEISRSLLDSEISRSPVFTKKLYRAISERDSEQYQKQQAYLEQQRSTGKISQRSYEMQMQLLKNAYEKAHKNDLAAQTAQIKENPSDAFYAITMDKNRVNFITLSHPDVKELNDKDYKKFISKAPPLEKSRHDNTENSLETSQPTFTAQQNIQRTPVKTKKRLGKKLLNINLGAFN